MTEPLRQRPDWDEYFLRLAALVATRATCCRRQVGAVLVKHERIIATGYNGAARGLGHCFELGCLRQEMGIPSGQRYELCRGVHAEQNAIINAAYYGTATQGSTLYCTAQPCLICARILINAGLERVVHCGNFEDCLALQFMQEAGLLIEEKHYATIG